MQARVSGEDTGEKVEESLKYYTIFMMSDGLNQNFLLVQIKF